MKKKILIIEDEVNLANSISMRLENAGYKVIVANEGIKGWEMLQKERPALVLLDIMLPGIDGYEICKLSKTHKKTKKIPIIILSAKSRMNEVDEGFDVGADGYIIKPYDPVQLLEKIKSLI